MDEKIQVAHGIRCLMHGDYVRKNGVWSHVHCELITQKPGVNDSSFLAIIFSTEVADFKATPYDIPVR